MFSLSTSWNAAHCTNGFDIVSEIRSIGFDTIELSFALTETIVRDIFSLKEKGEIKVSSLHNMCPLPQEITPKDASPDYYSLSSLNTAQRMRAVAAAKNTIDWAERFDARAVVLHIGRVETKSRTRELATLLGDEKRYRSVRQEMERERTLKKADHVARVMESLGELVPYAHERGVMLGIENRYYHREIPSIEEFEEIFSRFPAGTLFYWHDVGHAEVFERLGLAKHQDFLERFSNRLIGIHLHDIIGSMHDHQAPGSGTFDFTRLKPYVRADTITVIEAHQPATPEEIHRGVVYLTKIFERQ